MKRWPWLALFAMGLFWRLSLATGVKPTLAWWLSAAIAGTGMAKFLISESSR